MPEGFNYVSGRDGVVKRRFPSTRPAVGSNTAMGDGALGGAGLSPARPLWMRRLGVRLVRFGHWLNS